MIVSKIFYFEAAHYLPGHDHCGRIHGHSYKLEVQCEGGVNPQTGMVIDFGDISKVVKEKVISKIDHSFLNDIIEIPTAENILLWVGNEISSSLPVSRLRLWETRNSYAELEV